MEWNKGQMRQDLAGQFFSVEFIKKDGSIRKMVCILPTSNRFFSGGTLKGNREHLLEVLDVAILKDNPEEPKKAWRSINLGTLQSLKAMGKQLVH